MAQSCIAGGTSYENQSISDIVEDIKRWIEYSDSVRLEFEKALIKVKGTEFYKKVPFDYKAMMFEVPNICKTNADDFRIVLDAIENRAITNEKVNLLWKIGKRAHLNFEDNKKYFKLRDDGYWHEYDNPEFRIIENLYATFGDYCATLWDVTNAASRLRDYIDIPKEISTMKYEDNSIKIGDNNSINNSAIGANNSAKVSHTEHKEQEQQESLFAKVFWRYIVPVVVGITVAGICLWLGLK